MAIKTDEKTMKLIGEVKRQKDEIAKLDHPIWKTSCSFTYEGKVYNLHVESDVASLVNIAAFIIAREEAYYVAAKALDLDTDVPDFKWGGFPKEDWLDDLKTRIGKIQIISKRRKLEMLESRLQGIISPELKRQMELDAISSELGI